MASVLLSGYAPQRNALVGAVCVGTDKEKMRIQIGVLLSNKTILLGPLENEIQKVNEYTSLL